MLFAKKDYTCEKCGKLFTKRINLNGNLCDECWNKDANERRAAEALIPGYIQYANTVLGKTYSTEEMYAINNHRQDILNKYQNPNGISSAALANAGDNYRKLSNEQAAEILIRISNASISTTMGAAYTNSFFIPTQYDGVIIDTEDIFAVGYTKDHKHGDMKTEVILCAIFTNDPYIPVFPMLHVGKMGFFELTKSKHGRAGVTGLFSVLCPNLTYPVTDLKQLNKNIKQDTSLKGQQDKSFVLDQISKAISGSGLFNTQKMFSELLPLSTTMLDNIGYIQDTEIDRLLKMDHMLNRNFWNKQANLLSKS